MDEIGAKVLRVFLVAIHSHLYCTIEFYPHPLSKSGLKLVCTVNIGYRNLKSENSQVYAQKPQRNCTFMKSAPVLYQASPIQIIPFSSPSHNALKGQQRKMVFVLNITHLEYKSGSKTLFTF